MLNTFYRSNYFEFPNFQHARQSIAAISAALTGIIQPGVRSVIASGFRFSRSAFVGILVHRPRSSVVKTSKSLPSFTCLESVVTLFVRLFICSYINTIIIGPVECYLLFSPYSGPGGQPPDRDIHDALTGESKENYKYLS